MRTLPGKQPDFDTLSHAVHASVRDWVHNMIGTKRKADLWWNRKGLLIVRREGIKFRLLRNIEQVADTIAMCEFSVWGLCLNEARSRPPSCPF